MVGQCPWQNRCHGISNWQWSQDRLPKWCELLNIREDADLRGFPSPLPQSFSKCGPPPIYIASIQMQVEVCNYSYIWYMSRNRYMYMYRNRYMYMYVQVQHMFMVSDGYTCTCKWAWPITSCLILFQNFILCTNLHIHFISHAGWIWWISSLVQPALDMWPHVDYWLNVEQQWTTKTRWGSCMCII